MNDRDMPPDDWEDRVVDRALEELHGDRPPDLAPAIERALFDGHKRPVALAATASRRMFASTLAAMALAAAALVVALLSWAWSPPADVVTTAARLQIAVEHGALSVVGRTAALEFVAGDTAVVALERGDRLRAAAATSTSLRIGPFGIVRTDPGTELEVVDMDVRARNGWVTAGSLTLAVIAGGASWHWITVRGTAAAGEVLHMQTSDEGTLASELQAARSTAEQLQRENKALEERLAALEAGGRRQAAAGKPEQPAPDALVTAETPLPATGAPAFDDERFAALLAEIDWQMLGKVASEMGIPLVELMQKIENGEEVPMEARLALSKLNMQLVEQLPKIMAAGLPGSPGNGTWTHPLVVGNQIAGLLASGKLPLDAGQQQAIAALVRRFTAEAQGIHDDPTELELDRLVGEVAMKDRMYDEIAQHLTPQQRAMLYPEGAGTFDGTSLFHSGLVWQGMSQPINASTPVAYVDATAQRLTEQCGLTGPVAQQVRAILEHAATNAPAEVWARSSPMERMEGARFMRSGRAMRAAQMQRTWLRRVLREVPLSPEQREQLRTMQRVLVPVPR